MSEKLESTGQHSQKGEESLPEGNEKEENPTISNVEYPSTTASSFSSEEDNVYTRKEHAPMPEFKKKKKSLYFGFEVAYCRNFAKYRISKKLVSLLKDKFAKHKRQMINLNCKLCEELVEDPRETSVRDRS